MSLRRQIGLAVVGPTVLYTIVFAGVVQSQIRADRLADLDASLRSRAIAVSGTVEHDHTWEVEAVPDHVTAPLAALRVIGDDGTLLVDIGAPEGRRWAATLPVESREGSRSVQVEVWQDTSALESDLRSLLVEITAVGAALTGLAAAFALHLSSRIVESEAFRDLRSAWLRQRRFTADASHELRTPITTIRTEAEVALRRLREPEAYRTGLRGVLEGTARMETLIEHLLQLARADDTPPPDERRASTAHPARSRSSAPRRPGDVVGPSRIDWANGVRRAAAQVPGRDRLRLELPPAAFVSGVAPLLEALAHNLIVNALTHTDGDVRVSVTRSAGDWVLCVDDDGPGIEARHVPHLFEPFYRCDEGRSRASGGTGLGLSLVERIARRHGGSVSVETRPATGSRFEVRIAADE